MMQKYNTEVGKDGGHSQCGAIELITTINENNFNGTGTCLADMWTWFTVLFTDTLRFYINRSARKRGKLLLKTNGIQ